MAKGGRYFHDCKKSLVDCVPVRFVGTCKNGHLNGIYCAPPGDPEPMAAILLSTGSPGTEGTLGGLVEQGHRIHIHLRHAWRLGSLCSNDPVCAAHSPKEDLSERYLEGAACHGCLFIAESSCERFNCYLDRALVGPVIGQDPRLAFFEEEP